ncbi:MAG: FtsX-like permease family protein [Clostridia bacterium]
MINTITYILIGVAAIAVIVAMLLVAIILYISVQDRTKEIGLLRSLGASKGNVSSVFIAETFIIGLVSGVVGVLLALVLTFPANIIINSTLGISGLLRPVWWHQFALIGIAFVITVISGLIPAALAAKKDPVLALRTE